jgi:hypothetical protein
MFCLSKGFFSRRTKKNDAVHALMPLSRNDCAIDILRREKFITCCLINQNYFMSTHMDNNGI